MAALKPLKATFEIKNKKGIHARAAAAFVKAIEPFECECFVTRIGQRVSGCSIMGLMMLAASQGTKIDVEMSGKNAKDAMEALEKLIDNKFGEE